LMGDLREGAFWKLGCRGKPGRKKGGEDWDRGAKESFSQGD